MSQEVYKVWFMKYTEAWYQLTPEAQTQLTAQVQESLKKVGGEMIMARACVWASEEWIAWGVEKYPDATAAEMHALTLYAINWYRYIESKSYLGVELPQM
jgi:hypothetical protein